MWFTENAWQPILMFAIVGMLCGISWYCSRSSRSMFGIFACVVAMIATAVLEPMIITDRERVHESVVGITKTFAVKDLEGSLEYVSDKAPDLKALVAFAHDVFTVENMRLTDIQVELTSGDTRAISRFRVNADFSSRFTQGTFREPTRWESRWQLEEGEWRMIEISKLDPLTGEVEYSFLDIRNYLVPRF